MSKRKPFLRPFTIPMPNEKRENFIHLKQGLLTLASGLEVSEMVSENKSGQMVLATKVTGKTTEHMAKASSFTLMEIFMKVTGSTIRPMDTVCTSMLTVQDMKVSGKMICNMVMVKKAGQMVHFTKESISQARSTELVFTAGMMALVTTVNGRRTKLKE